MTSMRIALVEGVRSQPVPGAKGVCQACGEPMTAKCGGKNIWHWAHKGRKVCDPWWENEGEWHRAWKKYFPTHSQEVVQFDHSGEKHIADVKLSSGLVVELQHSAMSPEEMRSRENFYEDMVWIVDAGPFKKGLHIFQALPDPAEPFVADLSFVTPMPEWRGQTLRENGFDALMFMRRSEQKNDATSYLMHSGRELAEHFPSAYRGHHLHLWVKPRSVWYQTTKPTYLDIGEGLVAQLAPYGPWHDTFMCLRLLPKEKLIMDLLGGENLNAHSY